jgi:ABC-2 type transport system permease protein
LLQATPTRELVNDILLLLLAGVILIPIGYKIFLAGERYAKKHGKLKRSG